MFRFFARGADCEKVRLSLVPSDAVSEIYTVGKHFKKATFDVKKFFFLRTIKRELATHYEKSETI